MAGRKHHGPRAWLYRILEDETPPPGWATAVRGGLVALIIINVAAATFETVSQFRDLSPLFVGIEQVSVMVFTVEYLLRLWAAGEPPHREGPLPPQLPATALGRRLRWIVSPLALIDLLAILPFYLAAVLPVDLRMLRVFRLLRILKLSRYSPALATLGRVLVAESRAVLASLLVMAVLLLVAASLMFWIEGRVQPEAFSSIPMALWWAVSTVSTVGYGDVVPVTALGKLVGGVVMLLGIGVFVLWTSVLASAFAAEMRRRDFVVSWTMVARVPAFSHLPADRIAEIADLLQSESVPARYTITRRGETANSMYFILSGEVELDIHPEPVRLGPGQSFGEIALLQGSDRTATVTALTDCRLLVLPMASFHNLLDSDPRLRAAIVNSAERRARGDTAD
ncbi:MAG: cyclic nucleotide-gated ion channel [Alphaproteobacteria bacterium]